MPAYFDPSVFCAFTAIVWAIATAFTFWHMAIESDCFTGGVLRSIMFGTAGFIWSGLVGVLGGLAAASACALFTVLTS